MEETPYFDEGEDDFAGAPRRGRRLAPHRGAAVLTLGILGIAVCFICGIIAWVMGNADLQAMREGRMDRSGEGSTSAGRICGIVATILAICGAVVFLLVLLGGAGMASRHVFD